jgi:8-oxo-dGTP pyrophosphatase MutT (NUDIX family)
MPSDAALPHSLAPYQRTWLELVDGYAQAYPGERAVPRQFAQLMADDPLVASRERRDAHLSASAWLVSGDGRRVLLTHHRKLDRWLQLGGHADGDTNLARVALREAEEESGLAGLAVEPPIFDLDRHRIPARGDEPEHWHYDVRFVVHAGSDETFVISDESHALAWRDIASLAADADADASLLRMARKWLARQYAGRSCRCAAPFQPADGARRIRLCRRTHPSRC